MAIFFIYFNTVAQSASEQTQLVLKEIGWTLDVPKGFSLKDSGTTNEQMPNDIQLWRKRFAFKNNNNTFAFSISKFSNQNEAQWDKTYKMEKNRAYDIITKQKPLLKIDSSTSIMLIGNVEFHKFVMTAKENSEMVFNQIQLSKYYNGYKFQLTYISLDKSVIDEIEKVLKNSKFN